MKAAQGSSLHGMDERHKCSNATLLMNLRQLWKTHREQLLYASGSVLVIIASYFRGFVALLYSK